MLWRKVDFGEEHLGIAAKVLGVEYDPNRNAYLLLVDYGEKGKGYLIAPQGVKVGDTVLCAEKTEAKSGNRMKLENIPAGTTVYNVELEPGRGGTIVRGAGTGAKLMAVESGFALLQLPSGEIRKVSSQCFASLGMVSNPGFKDRVIGKAGSRRRKGWRPQVRGTAMNPVDHPHGGGEGRTPRGMKYPKTPWGKPALGVKTRNKKKWTSKLIVSRRPKKKGR
jgi:large subunit ribosomal protein L2